MIPWGTSIRSAAAAAWSVAGLLWLLIWLHGARTHGVTQVNEKRLWLGLTWMDSAKFLVVSFLAVLLALYLSAKVGRPLSRWGRLAWGASLAVVAVQVVGVALQFWPFPWGSYRVTFEARSGFTSVGGPLQAVASLLGVLLLALAAVALAQAGAVRLWVVPVLAVGMLTTFYLTPASWVPALAWLLMAVALWTGGPRHDGHAGTVVSRLTYATSVSST